MTGCFSASAEEEAALFFAPSIPPDGISADGGDGDDDDLELHDPMVFRWKIVRQINQRILKRPVWTDAR